MRQRFKQKLRQFREPNKGEQHRVQKGAEELASQSEIASDAFNTGIKILYAPEQCNVDIVFIHGLTGHLLKTWTADGASVPWPTEFLPQKIPNARIMTFGYDAYVTDWHRMISENRIGDHAMTLLTSVARVRDDDDSNKRPIFFVCHSLGGLVCQDALVLARQSPEEHLSQVLFATRGVAFLGTPNRGSGLAEWAEKIARALGLVKQTNTDIVGVLRRDSEILSRIQDGFHSMLRSQIKEAKQTIAMTCFFEELPLVGIGKVVSRESATVPGFIPIGIHADHMGMTKFDRADDPGFNAVVGELRRWSNRLGLDRKSSVDSDRPLSFTASENRYIASFGPRRFLDLEERVQGTCVWSTNTKQFLAWRQAEESSVLWLTGAAGCGKTFLTQFLIQYLTDDISMRSLRASTGIVCYFFCVRGMDSQNNVRALLKDLIMQVLASAQGVVHQVKASFGSTKHEYDQSFETLWRIFVAAIEFVPCHNIYIVIDALDECEERLRPTLLTKIAKTLMYFATTKNTRRKTLKIVFSGQQQIWTAWGAGITRPSHYHIDLETRPDGMVHDIGLYIDAKVDDLIQSTVCSWTVGLKLKECLKSLAETSFLWLSIVLDSVRTTPLYCESDIERLLDTMPQNLQDAYTKYLPRIFPEEVPRLKKYLKFLTGCARPLSLSEIYAFSVQGDASSDPNETISNLQVLKGSIQRALGPLVKFSDGTVQLVHSTVRDYIQHLVEDATHTLSQSHGVSEADANLLLATSCIDYLMNDKIPPDLFAPSRPSTSSTLESPVSRRYNTDAKGRGSPSLNDIYDLESVMFMKDENTTRDEACEDIRVRHQAYDYAALYWTHHWARSEHIAPQSTFAKVVELLSCQPGVSSDWYVYRSQTSRLEMPQAPDRNPITLAAYFDHPRILENLVTHENRTNIATGLSKAMFWAASKGNCRCIELLIRLGARPCPFQSVRSPLALAVRGGYADACLLLLESEFGDPNLSDSTGTPALVLAAAYDHVEILKALMKRPLLQVNQTDNGGQTALMKACAGGFVQCVQALLNDKRLDVNQVDHKGRNCLHHAAISGSGAVLKILLSVAGLNRTAVDLDGRTTISLAAQHGHLTTVKRLHHARVSASVPDNNGRNSISWAADSARASSTDDNSGESVLAYLVSKYPDAADTRDNQGWSPLGWALNTPGYLEAVKILVESGHVGINQRESESGTSILMWALGMDKILRYFLSRKDFDVNQTGSDGRTLLAYAAAGGKADTVRLLLSDERVNASLKDAQGRVPSDWARLNGHHDLAEELEGYEK